MAVDVGESAVDAIVSDGQPGVVDSQQMQDGGVYVVAVGGLVFYPEGPQVAAAIGDATFDPSTSQPVGKGKRIVVAAFTSLAARSAAELRCPEDDRVVEQTERLEIFD